MYIFRYLSYLTAITLFISSCANKLEDTYVIPSIEASDAKEFTISIDSVSIPISHDQNVTYYTYSTYSDGNIDFISAYNPKAFTIDIFNLSSRKLYKRIECKQFGIDDLDDQDLDKGRSITDLYIINFDSILVNYGNRMLLMIDTNSKIRKIINLDQLSIKNSMNGNMISYANDFKMHSFEGELLLNSVYPDSILLEKKPVVASLNLRNEKLTPLPISFSDYLFKIKGRAGFLSNIITSEHQKKGLFTYSFKYESNIYQYDSKNAKIIGYGAKGLNKNGIVDSLRPTQDVKLWKVHFVENPHYLNVIYDKYRHVYYRFVLDGIPYKNGKYFHSAIDKPLRLMFFNEKFEIIKEVDMPAYTYAPSTWFVTKEGLFISPTNLKNPYSDPNHLRFHIFKLHKK